METKRCMKCEIDKPIDQFYKHPKMKSGYKNICISCCKTYLKEYIKLKRSSQGMREQLSKRRMEANNNIPYENEYKKLFPEKIKAASAVGGLPGEKGKHKHHWCYKNEYRTDIIYLTPSEHHKAHHYMVYDQERMMYRRLDGTLLDTKVAHLEYIKGLF